jgi:hypothetical protein
MNDFPVDENVQRQGFLALKQLQEMPPFDTRDVHPTSGSPKPRRLTFVYMGLGVMLAVLVGVLWYFRSRKEKPKHE